MKFGYFGSNNGSTTVHQYNSTRCTKPSRLVRKYPLYYMTTLNMRVPTLGCVWHIPGAVSALRKKNLGLPRLCFIAQSSTIEFLLVFPIDFAQSGQGGQNQSELPSEKNTWQVTLQYSLLLWRYHVSTVSIVKIQQTGRQTTRCGRSFEGVHCVRACIYLLCECLCP